MKLKLQSLMMKSNSELYLEQYKDIYDKDIIYIWYSIVLSSVITAITAYLWMKKISKNLKLILSIYIYIILSNIDLIIFY